MTPTTEPAVPGAFGANPTPPAVAMAIASQSVFVFTMSIGAVDFFRRPFFRVEAEFLAGPFAEIDQFATLAAKWAVWIVLEFDFLFTSWAFHGIALKNSPPKLGGVADS